MNPAVYLSQEGFEEQRRGIFYSREVGLLIESTVDENLWNVTLEQKTYKDIFTKDLPIVVEAVHTYKDTAVVIVLYNLQRDVLLKKIVPIKEDI